MSLFILSKQKAVFGKNMLELTNTETSCIPTIILLYIKNMSVYGKEYLQYLEKNLVVKIFTWDQPSSIVHLKYKQEFNIIVSVKLNSACTVCRKHFKKSSLRSQGPELVTVLIEETDCELVKQFHWTEKPWLF